MTKRHPRNSNPYASFTNHELVYTCAAMISQLLTLCMLHLFLCPRDHPTFVTNTLLTMGYMQNMLHLDKTPPPAPPTPGPRHLPLLPAWTLRYCGRKAVHLPVVEVSCVCRVWGYQILESVQWWWLYSPARYWGVWCPKADDPNLSLWPLELQGMTEPQSWEMPW
jgi:hypothetical protein